MQSSNRQSADAGDFLDHLASLFASHDANLELDGRLSNSAHMLQTAAAAEAGGAQACLVAAALLHDIGHWLRDESIDAQSMDRHHELVGARYLAAFFGDDVTRPIALHVAAKRYLCAREPDYFASLTPGSVRSLALPGGPLSETQETAFEALPYHDRAVALRRRPSRPIIGVNLRDQSGVVPRNFVRPAGGFDFSVVEQEVAGP